MSDILARQQMLLHSIVKALDNFKKFGKKNYSAAKIRSRMGMLKETWQQCLQGHAALARTLTEEQKADLDYFKDDQLDVHEEIYQTTHDFMAEWLEELEPVVNVSPNHSFAESTAIRSDPSAFSLRHLPPIKLPPFNGNFDEWETFRDRFRALIIDNPELSDFARMHFLSSSLSGRAREAISSISITAQNFATAWQALTNRFENKTRLIETHVTTLANLPAISRKSASALHSLRDTADQALSALFRLGRKHEDIVNDILIYFVTTKLDPATRRAWKLRCGSESNPLKYDDLTKFISSRANALDELSPTTSSRFKIIKANNATASANVEPTCPLCKNAHYLSRCPTLLNKTPIQRREYIKESRRCFNCFSMKHVTTDCQSNFTCRICHKRHHSLLHLNSPTANTNLASVDAEHVSENADSSDAAQSSDSECPDQALAHSSISQGRTMASVLLATATITVSSEAGREQTVRALLDQGSEVTFISEKLAQRLKLQRARTLTTISAVGCADAGVCRSTARIKISSRYRSGPTFSTRAFVLPALTKYTPRCCREISDWQYLENLSLADENPFGLTPIEIIIGADLYSSIILGGIRKAAVGEPIAQQSHLGWLISGPTTPRHSPTRKIKVHHCSLEQDIQKFWEIEEPPSHKILSPEEQNCETHFQQTHSRAPDGRYIVRIPFKQGPPINIGESRNTAVNRLNAINRKLLTDNNLKHEYENFLTEYEQLGHMNEVPSLTTPDNQVVYIPHHPVVRSSSLTTKVRVVFNASSITTNGTSLNSHMHSGPKLQSDLVAVLLRWRQYKYVFSADIAKMYRQILVDPRDRNYQRILWSGHAGTTIKEFQLTTVTYGTAAAPYLALRVLKQLVHDEGHKFPLASGTLTDNIYVDDVLFGAEDIPLILCTKNQVCELLLQAGFVLRKWASNRSELLSDIPAEDHGLACNRELQLDESLKILGIAWNPALDKFQFNVSLPSAVPCTKRTILSIIAKIFDPLGWITPVTVSTKIFMQQLWRTSVNWDDNIPQPYLTRWTTIYKELQNVNGLSLTRWTNRGSDSVVCELHGFADASTVAYAAAVYMRIVSISGESTVTLLLGKSKVAPIKPITVPRLELLAAVLLARLIQFSQSALNLTGISCYCWTDSTVVLTWLSHHPSKWKTFVSHRTAEIQHRIPSAIWRHIPTQDNPADCASRGMLGSGILSHSLWWTGPSWLPSPSAEWPDAPSLSSHDMIEEAKAVVTHAALAKEPWTLASKFSSWPKLIRITAYVLRFISRCKNPGKLACDKSNYVITGAEYHTTQTFWIRHIQSELFPEIISSLQNQQALSSQNSLTKLNPFLDTEHVVRVGGRLENAPLAYQQKHQILLASHPLVRLLIKHMHLKHLHAGVQLTLAALRREYWILKSRSIVKQEIYHCVTCIREKAAVPRQLMGQLPQARVTAPSRAFLHVGVDYAGPVLIRTSPGRGIKSHKGYIALFICLASRAIHFELVSDYSAATFVHAFSRFCSRRGLPTHVYSDNGTTFTGADKELTIGYKEALQNPEFLSKIATDQINWQFIPPQAPHFGGIWEAGVKSVKYHLRRVLKDHTLTYEEFSTLLCNIEACLNSRPIGPISDSIEDFNFLTPGHFLIGAAITLSPEPSLLAINENRLTRWQLVRQMTEQFWSIWQSDYINTLQQRIKWKQTQPSIKPGTMVLVRNPLLPPCKWELGRVTQCYPGSDGLTRVVSVRTATSEYKRPLVKLCVLPSEIEQRDDKKCNNPSIDHCDSRVSNPKCVRQS